MSLTLSNFTNIGMEAISAVEKFLKRDFFELFHIKDSQKIDIFYKNTIDKNISRLVSDLLHRNSQYGVLFKNKVLNQSDIGIYWAIDLIDDKTNFVNSINYWGVTLSLYSKLDNKLLKTMFYMPMLSDLYVAGEHEGFFLSKKKLSSCLTKKAVIVTDMVGNRAVSSLVARVFGSETLGLFFRAAAKIDKLYIKRTDYHLLLSNLLCAEAKLVSKISESVIEI